MKVNEIENELKKVLNLDKIQYLKSDDIAIYFEGREGQTSIQVKYVHGKVYIKNKEKWNIIKGLMIH